MISFLIGHHRFHLRAAAVMVRDDSILLHRADGDPFWALPGGRVEAGESAEQAVIRELKEELCTDVRPTRLVWVVENFFSHHAQAHHEIGMYFMAEPSSESVLASAPGPYAGTEGTRRLEFAWFSADELALMDIRPSFLVRPLIERDFSFRHVVHRDEQPAGDGPRTPHDATAFHRRRREPPHADHVVRVVDAAQATAASALVHRSFMTLAATDWEPHARQVFLGESSPTTLHQAMQSHAYAAGAFSGDTMIGFILMPRPSVLGMLFVDPDHLRRGIARQLWESARAHIQAKFPEVKTVELNATPYALSFYRSVGFMPISAEFEKGGCRATRMACWLPARSLHLPR